MLLSNEVPSRVERTRGDIVTAIFADKSAHQFPLRRQATLGELAAELDACGQRHGGLPRYVRVTFRP